jgi:hypothetical protein
MLFYTSLLVACLVGAVVIIWLYRKVAYNAGSVYKTVHPIFQPDPADNVADGALRTSAGAPWGVKDHATPSNLAKTHAAKPTEQKPWGWKGSGEQAVREQHPHHGSYTVPAHASANSGKPGAGWPYREEKQEFAGKAYKVTRKAKPSTTKLGADGKPWGW